MPKKKKLALGVLPTVVSPGAIWADVGAGTVTAYFVDNGRLGVLVQLELYPDKDGPDFHCLGHELCLGRPRPKPSGN
jgi:hypothetical protein